METPIFDIKPRQNMSKNYYNRNKRQNANLKELRYIWNGDVNKPIVCSLTKQMGLLEVNGFNSEESDTVMNFDVDHIVTTPNGMGAGISRDKNNHSPSTLLREKWLKYEQHIVVEMMTCWPLLMVVHKHKTMSSLKEPHSLSTFRKEYWTWCLQSEDNFESVCEKYELWRGGANPDTFNYKWFIEHMMDPYKPSITAAYYNLYWNISKR